MVCYIFIRDTWSFPFVANHNLNKMSYWNLLWCSINHIIQKCNTSSSFSWRKLDLPKRVEKTNKIQLVPLSFALIYVYIYIYILVHLQHIYIYIHTFILVYLSSWFSEIPLGVLTLNKGFEFGYYRGIELARMSLMHRFGIARAMLSINTI